MAERDTGMISVIENCKQGQNRMQITKGKIDVFNKIKDLYDKDTKNKLARFKQKYKEDI